MTWFTIVLWFVWGVIAGCVLFVIAVRPKPGCSECYEWNEKRKQMKAALKAHSRGHIGESEAILKERDK